MSDQKSKRILKFKTLEEVQNSDAYEIHLFSKKRQTPSHRSNMPMTTEEDDDDDDDDQAPSDSDAGDDSDEDIQGGTNDKSISVAGQKRTKQRKTYAPELLPTITNDDSGSKSMINISNYLMKKRKWPYRGWHKRFFLLQDGYIVYAKSEQDFKRGRLNGRFDVGSCCITFIREAQRIDIDELNRVYHLKIKEPKVYEQWLEQLALHKKYRLDYVDRQKASNKNEIKQNIDESNLSNSSPQTTEDSLSKDFSDIQKLLTNLSDILEHIRLTSNNSASSSASTKSTDGLKPQGHTPSASISSVNSAILADVQRQEYYDVAKTVFDNLNNLYRSLSIAAFQQQNQLSNTSMGENDIIYHSLSPTASMSRQGSIFYDALEAHGALILNRDKDALGKLSDSESSSEGEEDGPTDEPHHQVPALPPLKLSKIKWPRSSLPATTPDTANVGLWNIMRKSIGKDLSRIAMPIILNEPLGLLQKLCEEMEYSELLDRASQIDDPHLRLVYVGAFIVSTYSSNHYRTGRKNFNPLLGETYECIREDNGWKFIAEQVSHHPPISVCTCDSSNFIFSQQLQAKIKFWGKSMEIFPESLNILKFKKYNETITWNKCTMCIHNVLSSERWIDHYGDILVESSLGAKSRISFIQSDYRTRLNNVVGVVEDVNGKQVHKIFGRWHEHVYFGNDQSAKCIWRQSAIPENSKQYYGFTRFAMQLNELDEDLRQQLPPTDTRFRPDQRLLEEGRVEAAEKEKARLEADQRSRSSIATSPKWYRLEGDTYVLVRDEDSSHYYWKKREENWVDVEFTQLW